MQYFTSYAVVEHAGNTDWRNNANNCQQRKHDKPINETKDKGVNLTLTVTIKDILELIPSYSGAFDMCEFVCFKHGCKEALNLIGLKNEKTLLVFLKLKLKGLIYAELSLHLSKFNSIEVFLNHLEKDYPFINSSLAWKNELHIYQKEYKTIDLYARRFQYILQCIRVQFDCDYVIDKKEKLFRLIKMDNWERIAKYFFIQNLISVKLQIYLADIYDLNENLDSLMRKAYRKICTLKEKSTCKLCFEDNHVDENCTAMKRNYYAVFKEAVRKEKYEIINNNYYELPIDVDPF